MPMDNVANLQTSSLNVFDTLRLWVCDTSCVILSQTFGVGENPIPLPFTHIKGFAVSRVNQAIHIPLEVFSHS